MTHVFVISIMAVCAFAAVGICILATYIWEKLHGR